MKNASLVILAAGIGSRFGGGIKQLEPVGPNGEIIMDYSIHDAIEAGFNKVVFIIRRDLDEDFRRIIGDRISKVVEVAYAYQALDDLPEGSALEIIPGAIAVVTERVKKLGGDLKVRMGAPGKDGPVISDSGNLIADAKFGIIENPDKLARDLEHIVGIVGHGLFVGMATKVILADADKGLVEF